MSHRLLPPPSPVPHPPFRSQGGFTLLELIIAVAVIALVAGVIGGVLRLGSRAWERGEQRLEEQQRGRDLMALVSQELRSVYPYQIKEGERRIFFFRGEEARVQFVSSLSDPGPDPGRGLRLVTIALEDGQGLFIMAAPLLGGQRPEEVRAPAHLLDGRVRELHLRYLGAEGWVNQWEPKEVPPQETPQGKKAAELPEPTPRIPRAVEITLTLSADTPEGRRTLSLPPITIAVFAAIDLKKSNPAGGPGS